MVGCERLGKRYGNRWLFRDLDLRIDAGQCLVIKGQNGSGKSTLLKVIAGLLPATAGRRIVVGSLGYSAVDLAVYPSLTVQEHLHLAADLRGCAHRDEELLERVSLSHARDLLARSLSTGMRARLKLALAVQANPAVLLLDEPGVSLDEAGRSLVESLIEECKTTTAILIATNDPAEFRYGTESIDLGS